MAMKMFLIRHFYDKFNQPLSRDAEYQEHLNNTCNFTGNEGYDKNGPVCSAHQKPNQS
jgi:hypothetical protein